MGPNPGLPIRDIPETCPDDRRRITIRVIPFQVETIAEIEVPRPLAGIPKIIVRRKLGLYEGAGITAIRLIAPRIIRTLRIGSGIIGSRVVGPLLVQGPVTAGKRRRDQDKLYTFGLFHGGVAG
jgi:hypothetical protein